MSIYIGAHSWSIGITACGISGLGCYAQIVLVEMHFLTNNALRVIDTHAIVNQSIRKQFDHCFTYVYGRQ